MKTLKEVYRAKNTIQANIVVSLLSQHEIEACVTGGLLESAVGELPTGWSTAPRIQVREEDFAKTRQLVMEWEADVIAKGNVSDDASDKANWICPECSEDVDGEFDVCWNCQKDRKAG